MDWYWLWRLWMLGGRTGEWLDNPLKVSPRSSAICWSRHRNSKWSFIVCTFGVNWTSVFYIKVTLGERGTLEFKWERWLRTDFPTNDFMARSRAFFLSLDPSRVSIVTIAAAGLRARCEMVHEGPWRAAALTSPQLPVFDKVKLGHLSVNMNWCGSWY